MIQPFALAFFLWLTPPANVQSATVSVAFRHNSARVQIASAPKSRVVIAEASARRKQVQAGNAPVTMSARVAHRHTSAR